MRLTGRLLTAVFMAGAMATAAAAQDTGNVYKKGDEGLTMPAVVKEVKPSYTDAAKRERIQGSVTLEVVVLKDGTVGEVVVTRSLDQTYGLDEQAVNAARQWRFKPGKKDGQPVPVRVELEFTFTLK
jgi:protein TonB